MAATELFTTPLFNDANLKALYRFNSGALTTDSKGSFTLTNTNTVGETASGKFGYASDFSATNSNKYFTCANDYGITNGAITMGGWFKMRAEPTSGNMVVLAEKGDGATQVAYSMYYANVGGTLKVQCYRQKGSVGADASQYTATLGTTDWHLLILTYDTTNVIAYVDGVAATPTASSGDGTSGYTDSLFIGRNINTGYYSSMYLDDFFIFNRALSAAEILQYYNGTWGNASFLLNFV